MPRLIGEFSKRLNLSLLVESRDLIFNWLVFMVPKSQARHSPSRRDLEFGLWFWLCMLHYAQSGKNCLVSEGKLSFHLICHKPSHEDRAISFNFQSIAIFIYTETFCLVVIKIPSSMTKVGSCLQWDKITWQEFFDPLPRHDGAKLRKLQSTFPPMQLSN